MPVLRFLLAFGSLAAASCGGGGVAPAGPEPLPLGRLVTSEPVTCAPNEDWSLAEGGGWKLRGIAEVACWLEEPPPSSLVLRFRPHPPTDRHAFRLAWDGSPLSEGPVWAGEELVAEVPASRLSPGAHRLTL
ncbi:MAG TPA: hypothetical protein VLF66_07770 [Thermoanaerobaculia bacterium]|nr:hypothetical protein [Thermoanaerobaculia bacterium]